MKHANMTKNPIDAEKSLDSKQQEWMVNFMKQEMTNVLENLEVQVGEISKQIPERSCGSLPSNTKTNLIEHCKVVTLRCGKTLEAFPKEDKAKEAITSAI